MGDMADWILSNIDYVPLEEEYERSISWVICRYCGKTGLIWKYVKDRWRLYDYDREEIHKCPVNPLKKKIVSPQDDK